MNVHDDTKKSYNVSFKILSGIEFGQANFVINVELKIHEI